MTSDLVESQIKVAEKVDEQRLWDRLMYLGQIGATNTGGVTRLALSDTEFSARHELIAWALQLKLDVYIDEISNLFFRLEGEDDQLAPVLTGSHIDTQPNGGKFDGAFGVVAALEALHAIKESGQPIRRSVEAVIWLNEEGSRFSPGMMGSEVFTGIRDLADVQEVKDSDGITVKEELERTLSEFSWLRKRPIGFQASSFIEAHIEQGPWLESAEIPVGVVLGIQGSRRYRVRVTGSQSHAGTEPMKQRKDALFSALDMIQAMRNELVGEDEQMKFTTGLFEILPNAPSVVPSSAYFSIDIRHPDSETLEQRGDRVFAICEANRGPCKVEVKQIAASASLEFPDDMKFCIREAANILQIPSMPIYSLAGHDARQLHYHCPTGMIFVPCHKGISHSDEENCNSSDLYLGTRVLAASLVSLAA